MERLVFSIFMIKLKITNNDSSGRKFNVLSAIAIFSDFLNVFIVYFFFFNSVTFMTDR